MKYIENKFQAAIIVFCITGIAASLYVLRTPSLLYKLARIKSEVKGRKIGTVKSVTKTVTRRPRSQWVWFNLEKNDIIWDEDRIFTRKDSGIQIEFPEGSATLLANTMIVLKSFGTITSFDIQYGDVQLTLKKNKKIRVLKENKKYEVEAQKDSSSIHITRQKSSMDFHLQKGEYKIANQKNNISLKSSTPDSNENLTQYKSVFAFEPGYNFITTDNKITLPFQFDHGQNGRLHVFEKNLNQKKFETHVGSSNELVISFKESGEFIATFTDFKTHKQEQRSFSVQKLPQSTVIKPVAKKVMPLSEPETVSTTVPSLEINTVSKPAEPQSKPIMKLSPPEFNQKVYSLSFVGKSPDDIHYRKISLPIGWKKVPDSFSYKIDVINKDEPDKVLFTTTTQENSENLYFDWNGSENLELRVAAKRKDDKEWISTNRSIASLQVKATLELEPPQLVLPLNSSQVFSMETTQQLSSLLLSWKSSKYATEYIVEVSKTPNFEKPLLSQITKKTDLMVTLSSDEKKLYWRVKALHKLGQSHWSEKNHFSFK